MGTMTDVAAPGAGFVAPSGDSGYSSVDGTSFATPLVSGAVVLLQQIYQGRFGTLPTVAQVTGWLEQGADPIYDPVTGLTIGRLDIPKAAGLIPSPVTTPTSHAGFRAGHDAGRVDIHGTATTPVTQVSYTPVVSTPSTPTTTAPAAGARPAPAPTPHRSDALAPAPVPLPSTRPGVRQRPASQLAWLAVRDQPDFLAHPEQLRFLAPGHERLGSRIDRQPGSSVHIDPGSDLERSRPRPASGTVISRRQPSSGRHPDAEDDPGRGTASGDPVALSDERRYNPVCPRPRAFLSGKVPGPSTLPGRLIFETASKGVSLGRETGNSTDHAGREAGSAGGSPRPWTRWAFAWPCSVGTRRSWSRPGPSWSTGGASALTISCDVADRSAVEAAVDKVLKEFGSIDILVCNAGTNVRNRSLETLTAADWDRMIEVNLTGPFNLVRSVLPGMRERKNGLVIQICSISGIRASTLGGAGYSASKFGQSALGMCLGREEGDERHPLDRDLSRRGQHADPRRPARSGGRRAPGPDPSARRHRRRRPVPRRASPPGPSARAGHHADGR